MIQFMKIFFYKYGSICEPDISDSFRRLGFEVIDEDMEIYNKNLLPSQCVKKAYRRSVYICLHNKLFPMAVGLMRNNAFKIHFTYR